MNILGIDTSCDDTGVAVVEAKKEAYEIKSNIVSSQVEIHRQYGGVYPTLAKREHQNNLVPVLEEALNKADFLNKSSQKINEKKLSEILQREPNLYPLLTKFLKTYSKPNIDIISVTIGPGLEPCLWVGVNFARALAHAWNMKIVPVNHLEAHLLTNFINTDPPLPGISLLASGGHTQLINVKDKTKYEIIGETVDDAAGECFDKTARILGLPYPGGPEISKKAEEAKNNPDINFPRPMINSPNYNFSFSGLKTAVLYNWKQKSSKAKNSSQYIGSASKEIQEAITDVLVKKTIRAAQKYKAKSIMISGGVAANSKLREKMREKANSLNFPFYFPPLKLCNDNGTMVAISAFYNQNNKKSWKNLEVNANLKPGDYL